MQKLVTLQFCDFLRNLAVDSKWQKKKNNYKNESREVENEISNFS